MNQVPVKWVYPDRLLSTDDGFTTDELAKAGRIPVVPLSALQLELGKCVLTKEQVEELITVISSSGEPEYWYNARNKVRKGFDTLRLLASLGEVGK